MNSQRATLSEQTLQNHQTWSFDRLDQKMLAIVLDLEEDFEEKNYDLCLTNCKQVINSFQERILALEEKKSHVALSVDGALTKLTELKKLQEWYQVNITELNKLQAAAKIFVEYHPTDNLIEKAYQRAREKYRTNQYQKCTAILDEILSLQDNPFTKIILAGNFRNCSDKIESLKQCAIENEKLEHDTVRIQRLIKTSNNPTKQEIIVKTPSKSVRSMLPKFFLFWYCGNRNSLRQIHPDFSSTISSSSYEQLPPTGNTSPTNRSI